MDFSYRMQTQIEFGDGRAAKLADDLSLLFKPGESLMVVTDPGVLQTGMLEPLLQMLHKARYQVALFSDVKPNPRDEDCLRGAALMREQNVSAVVAVGGGSAMDTAKTIALLGRSGGVPREYADGERHYEEVAPIICLPTTAGTGSEVTRSAVITEHATHRKMTLKHERLRPTLAILDPLLTRSVPPSVTAATGVDALVHAIEGATCRLSTPLSRAFGEQAMQLIVPSLRRAVACGEDLDARRAMLEGSLLAGLSFGSTDVAAVHCLAEALGGLYDTPHGVANAVFLPSVLRFNAEAYPVLHARLARVMNFASTADSDQLAVAKLLDGIRAWTAELGIPKLRDLASVRVEDFEHLADLAFQNGSTKSNVRPVTREDYQTLLDETYQWT